MVPGMGPIYVGHSVFRLSTDSPVTTGSSSVIPKPVLSLWFCRCFLLDIFMDLKWLNSAASQKRWKVHWPLPWHLKAAGGKKRTLLPLIFPHLLNIWCSSLLRSKYSVPIHHAVSLSISDSACRGQFLDSRVKKPGTDWSKYGCPHWDSCKISTYGSSQHRWQGAICNAVWMH